MFSLDLQARILTLIFSEAVQVSSLSINQFTLQNRRLTPTQSFSLTSSSSTQSSDGTDFIIDISNADFNSISALHPLSTSIEDTFLSVTSNGVQDFAGNNLVPIPSTSALPASNHSLDRTSPRLTAAYFDGNTGILRLEFDETVSLESFTPQAVRLQNSASSPSQSLVITAGTATRPINTAISLELSDADRNAIKSMADLLTDISNSFISFPSSLVQDMHSNQVTPALASAARAFSSITIDTTRPNLFRFDLDLNTGLISVSFDEVVNLSSLSLTEISLQNAQGSSLPLTNSLPSSTALLSEVSITISPQELDLLKQMEICLASPSCYLSATASLLTDTTSNPLMPISTSLPLLVSQYIPDTIPPQVLDFAILDLDGGGLISLVFSEVVRSSSFNAESIFLHERFANATYNLSISQQSTLQSSLSQSTLNLTLSDYDLNRIKLNIQLCISISSCFLTLNSQLVTDQSNNAVYSPPNQQFQPSMFIYDTTSPVLTQWELSLASTGLAVFLFDEIISEASFDVSQIVFHNPFGSNNSFTPSSGSFSRSDGFSIIYSFTQSDLDWIKNYRQICSRLEDCYIAFNSSLITDVSNNAVTPVSIGPSALRVISYTPDRLDPYLVAFTKFDLESRSFNLLFNEPVDISTVVFTNITISRQPYSYAFITLGGGEIESVDSLNKEVCTKKTNWDEILSKV